MLLLKSLFSEEKQREGKMTGPREKLGSDAVTTKASTNLVENSKLVCT